ncbi:hydroxyacylglutathione hydrolase [Acinetobacter marinus]|uniref:Hydroxyacylglutathione hydrolase n=1 Tax=Acinetobacter marinus TaxID=281375 RepID=A0A1G6M050_9GAMM|nr:hydroxyacylglutathione hydrolase [Acinetobacter marinus]SDC48831.1 hydroxyacylglutathione hydrolase [Acinetobacter marinus]
MQFRIEAIEVGNALQNYIWMLIDTHHHQAVAIDPTQADLVLDYCEKYNLELTQIWITHKHNDHIAGVPELKAQTNAVVYAPLAEKETIGQAGYWLEDGEQIHFADLVVDVFSSPGHTLGIITYFIDALDALFCSDTLFSMGCGRVFEGTYTQMYHSLNRLAALPPRTKVYCTHEYTESNGKFAMTIEPENIALQQRYAEVQALRATGKITLPSSIELELETNPFLRCQSVDEFKKIRQLKDQF